MSTIYDDIKGYVGDASSVLGVKDAFSLYKGINEINLAKSFQKSQNYINELNATAAIGRLQNQALSGNSSNLNPIAQSSTIKYLGYGALAVAGLAAAYLLLRK